MNRIWRVVLLLGFLISILVLFVYFVYAQNDLQCFLLNTGTCPGGSAKLIGLENDTSGYNNAHAQNYSYSNYAYSICCNNTNSSHTITNICPGNVTIVRLSNATNAHVELGNLSNYSYLACLGSDYKLVSCSYPTGSCSGGSACIMSMVSSEGDNQTNAHVGNCSQYNQKVCCTLENNAPSKPTLYYPVNGNSTVFERRPNFNWSTCTDPESDPVDYTINITCGASCLGNCPDVNINSISTTNYTLSNPLCVDELYNWSVSACDNYDACNSSVIWNFTILSVHDIVLIVNETSFGDMAEDDNNDTTNDNPPPLVLRNDGNVLLNISINASSLFDSVALDTYYYQFKADDNETSGSYLPACSQDASFAFMDAASKTIMCNMSYEDTADEGEIELNITIPLNEGAGAKQSIIKISSLAIVP